MLVTDLEELGANPKAPASGTVVEAELDPGRGPVTGVLVQRGTLHVGRCRGRRAGLGQGPGHARRQGRAGGGGDTRNPGRGPRLRRRQRSRRARPGGRERTQGAFPRPGARDPAEDRAARQPPGPQGHAGGSLPARQRRPAQGAQHRSQGGRLGLAGGAPGRDREAAAGAGPSQRHPRPDRRDQRVGRDAGRRLRRGDHRLQRSAARGGPPRRRAGGRSTSAPTR